jgi:Flp pilus assembly pilin Flp
MRRLERGSALVEYVLLVSLFVVALVGAVTLMRDGTSTLYERKAPVDVEYPCWSLNAPEYGCP